MLLTTRTRGNTIQAHTSKLDLYTISEWHVIIFSAMTTRSSTSTVVASCAKIPLLTRHIRVSGPSSLVFLSSASTIGWRHMTRIQPRKTTVTRPMSGSSRKRRNNSASMLTSGFSQVTQLVATSPSVSRGWRCSGVSEYPTESSRTTQSSPSPWTASYPRPYSP